MIELRSDTFTLPTPEMLAAIASATLGDESYREDPTVRELERLAASMVAKEAACLLPSGTMANLSAVLSHVAELTSPAVLVGDRSDIWVYEDRAVPTWAGVRFQPLATSADGTLSLTDIAGALQATSPSPVLLCLESPHNLCGGVVLSIDYVREAAAIVHASGARLHLDGARLFNAAARLRLAPAEIVREADSVQFCLSKGLAAPIGSIVAGSAALIERVRAARKRLGGDMHQAGIVAAPGIVALTRMTERLDVDHLHARRLADGLASLPGIEIDLDTVQTNTVVFRIIDSRFDCRSFIDALGARGVRLSEFGDGRIRAVTHHGITAEHIEQVVAHVAQLLDERPAAAAPR